MKEKSDNKDLNVLLIDPWGVNNTSEYLNGLAYGLSFIVNLFIATNYYFVNKTNGEYTLLKCFFKRSERMKKGIIRRIIRGFEYYFGYKKIISLLRKHKFDVVHINWLLNYKQDFKFLKRIKNKLNFKIVYTAHNVYPHINGKKYLEQLRKIYEVVDIIVVHGESVKEEFDRYYPDFSKKVVVQKHGCNLYSDTSYELDKIDDYIVSTVSKHDFLVICFGAIFFNKGFDRAVNYWVEKKPNALLVVAGSETEHYLEFDNLKPKMCIENNILFLDKYVDECTLHYLISNSDIILLPYRHASMSGVIFTAADFKKTVLSTDCGAIREYLLPGVDSFICPNNEKQLWSFLDEVLKMPKSELANMGLCLSENISKICDWSLIARQLLECYKR